MSVIILDRKVPFTSVFFFCTTTDSFKETFHDFICVVSNRVYSHCHFDDLFINPNKYTTVLQLCIWPRWIPRNIKQSWEEDGVEWQIIHSETEQEWQYLTRTQAKDQKCTHSNKALMAFCCIDRFTTVMWWRELSSTEPRGTAPTLLFHHSESTLVLCLVLFSDSSSSSFPSRIINKRKMIFVWVWKPFSFRLVCC